MPASTFAIEIVLALASLALNVAFCSKPISRASIKDPLGSDASSLYIFETPHKDFANMSPTQCFHRSRRYFDGQVLSIEGQPCLNCTCRKSILDCNFHVCPHPPADMREYERKFEMDARDGLKRECLQIKEANKCCPTIKCEISAEQGPIKITNDKLLLAGTGNNMTSAKLINSDQLPPDRKLSAMVSSLMAMISPVRRSVDNSKSTTADGNRTSGISMPTPGEPQSSNSNTSAATSAISTTSTTTSTTTTPAPTTTKAARRVRMGDFDYGEKVSEGSRAGPKNEAVNEDDKPTRTKRQRKRPKNKTSVLSGCFEDGRNYTVGEQIPVQDKCKHCVCARNGVVKCKLIECIRRVAHDCRPIISESHCCPIRYECPPSSSQEIKGGFVREEGRRNRVLGSRFRAGNLSRTLDANFDGDIAECGSDMGKNCGPRNQTIDDRWQPSFPDFRKPLSGVGRFSPVTQAMEQFRKQDQRSRRPVQSGTPKELSIFLKQINRLESTIGNRLAGAIRFGVPRQIGNEHLIRTPLVRTPHSGERVNPFGMSVSDSERGTNDLRANRFPFRTVELSFPERLFNQQGFSSSNVCARYVMHCGILFVDQVEISHVECS